MSYLAGLRDGEVASAREIAEKFGVPQSLLMNVLKELSAAGYIHSVRGAHGGYRMERSPEDISLADLITTVEGPIRLAECVAHEEDDDSPECCDLMDRCPISDPVHRVHRKLRDFLTGLTLDQIAPTASPFPSSLAK